MSEHNIEALAGALARVYEAGESATRDALAVRENERNAVRSYLINRGSLISKSERDPRDNRIKVREIIDFAGLADCFAVFGGKKLGCGPLVGGPETKPIDCIAAGCRDARDGQVGWIATALAVRVVEGREIAYSDSGHACPHTCESWARDYLVANAETRAKSRAIRSALGIQSATREEIGPERSEVESQTFEDVPPTAGCYAYLDGKGNDFAAPFGYRWRKSANGDGRNRWTLTRRTDSGSPPHPPVTCAFHNMEAP